MAIFSQKQEKKHFLDTAPFAKVAHFCKTAIQVIPRVVDENALSEMIEMLTHVTWRYLESADTATLKKHKNNIFDILNKSIVREDRTRLSHALRTMNKELSLRKFAGDDVDSIVYLNSKKDQIYSNRSY